MTTNLPSLRAVRAFEAAARHESIAEAASELCVTPAAVANQVRALERWLGVDLFIRKGSTLCLTPAGETFFTGSNQAIDLIRAVAQKVSTPDNRVRLSIVAPPSFAAQWLVPRIASFQSTRKIELSVSIRAVSSEKSWRTSDIGIVSSAETPPFLERRPFLGYRIIAVCSPRLLTGPNAIRSLSDLRKHSLLHDEGLKQVDGVDWNSWLRGAGHGPIDTSDSIRFSNNFTAYRYAADGHGVTLAKDVLVQSELARGELVNPFEYSDRSKRTYDFVCTSANFDLKPVAQFWAWLQREAQQDRALLPA